MLEICVIFRNCTNILPSCSIIVILPENQGRHSNIRECAAAGCKTMCVAKARTGVGKSILQRPG